MTIDPNYDYDYGHETHYTEPEWLARSAEIDDTDVDAFIRDEWEVQG
jgi:hypothetical protein